MSKRNEYANLFPSPMGCCQLPTGLQTASDLALLFILDWGVPGTNPKEGSRIKPRPLVYGQLKQCWS